MAYQTTYNSEPGLAYAGMVADTRPATIVSRTVEGDDIGFGLAVKRGAADRSVELTETGDTAGLLDGITVRVQSLDADTPNAIAAPGSIPVLQIGAIWVEVGGDVDAGDDVYVTVNGGAYTDGSVGTGKVQLANAKFETSATNGNLAIVVIT